MERTVRGGEGEKGEKQREGIIKQIIKERLEYFKQR